MFRTCAVLVAVSACLIALMPTQTLWAFDEFIDIALINGPFSVTAVSVVAATWNTELVAKYPPTRYLGLQSSNSYDTMMAHKMRATDIIVSTFPKTGTTLLLQLCHQLRSGGDMSFDDQYEVTPWLALGWDMGVDLEQPSLPQPRVYKSHARLSSEVPGAKYIVTLRDPIATLKSYHTFLISKKAPPAYHGGSFSHALQGMLSDDLFQRIFPRLTIDEFAYRRIGWDKNAAWGGSIWDYYTEYWLSRKQSNVLVIVYEDLLKDKATEIKKIAAFMGVTLSKTLASTVSNMTSVEFMKEHGSKFDESAIAPKMNSLNRGPSKWTPASRVGLSSDKHIDLSSETKQFMEQRWREIVTPITGHETYGAMVAALKRGG